MTGTPDPAAEWIATAALVSMVGRRAIAATDRRDPRAMAQTLDALHEYLGISGGSLVFLAERLCIEAEVLRLVEEREARITAAMASTGLGGRA